MALLITHYLLEQILSLAHQEHPIETCGMVASKQDSQVATRLIPLQNQAASESFFLINSREQLNVFREMEKNNEICRVIYHSHTASEAYPSMEDIDYAGNPEAHYLIISTWSKSRIPIRSFRITDKKVTEESITTTKS